MNQLIDLATRRLHQRCATNARATGIPLLIDRAERDAKVQRALERAVARWHAAAEERGCSLEEVRDAGDVSRWTDEELVREGL